MLQKRSPAPSAEADDWDYDASGPDLGDAIERVFAAVRRQWWIVAASVTAAVVVAVLYTVTAVPLYTSSIDILLGQNTSKVVSDLAGTGQFIQDDSAVFSQVELIKSEKIASRVVDLLQLPKDPAFKAIGVSPLSRLRASLNGLLEFAGWFSDGEIAATDEAEARQAAIDAVLGGVDVWRVGRSYVVSVSYTSPNPELAASIARGFGEAYIADQLEAKSEATRSASDWLQRRIDELKQRSLQSDLAVQKFKAEHGLVSTDGVLVSEQSLSQLNTRLIEAQGETAQAVARYQRIRSILESGDTNAVVSDALVSSLINELRGKYLDAAKRESEITKQLGPNHSRAVALRSEMNEYRRLMFEELGRIAESYQSDVEVAKNRERAIQESVAAATGVSVASNEVMVQLRELERESETYKSLYETFLLRYQESVQQETSPLSEARVITEAKVPYDPSHPDKGFALAIALVLGAALGTGIGALREFRDRFFRTGEQIRQELGLEFLGIAPRIASTAPPAEAVRGEDVNHPRLIRKSTTIANYVIDHPLTQFAETLRSVRFAADLALGPQGPKTIGIVSILPGEGKSTVAINLAEMLASVGSRTLLIDGDLRSPALTRAVARHATAGFIEAILEQRPLKDLLLLNPETKLAVLPAVVRHRISHTSDLLASAGTSAVLKEATQAFDNVIIDLPPLGPVIDARAIASKVDAFILVVEWGKTPRKAVRNILGSEPQIVEKCLGVVLNKVDMDKMKLYSGFGSGDYYYSSYSNYHQPGSGA